MLRKTFTRIFLLAAMLLPALLYCTFGGEGQQARAKSTPQQQEISLDLGGGVKLELVRIPAGGFMMGETEVARNLIGLFAPQELRVRHVKITKPFYVGKYEVTVDQFRRFVEATSYQTDAETGKRPWRGLTTGAYTVVDGNWGKDENASWKNPGFPQEGNHPVTCISWYDAVAFCQWVVSQTKRPCRLPTEAELEYAHRAGTPIRYYWGNRPADAGRKPDSPLGYWANVGDDKMRDSADEDIFLDSKNVMKSLIPKGRDDGYTYTAPVGMFYPNPFGLYDAIGNVWEYTLDWAGPNPGLTDPRGADSEKVRSMRGGSWISTPDLYRPSYRAEIEREGRTSTRGMRILVEK